VLGIVLGNRIMGSRAGHALKPRLSIGLGVATGIASLALLALAGAASAQNYPGPSTPYNRSYGGVPPLPPENLEPIDQSPAAAPPQAEGSPPAYPPPEDRTYGAYPRPVTPAEPQVYGRVAPAPVSPRPDEWQTGPRPPGDMDHANGAAPALRAPVPSGAIASLPPEYQAEQGLPKELPPHLRRQEVFYPTKEPAGTIVIDTPNTYLYLVLGRDKAVRYGIGVGREGFTWTGRERISRVAEWPDWTPPKEMIERQPYLPRFMAGGPSNPLGARALYLGSTVYRIHGTNQPSTIGTFVSSGCIRLTNADVEDLYTRVQVGTRVVVLPGPARTSASSQPTLTR
jgi:lipoprotein-anchoring transpeptidase ErfK/SrfK